MYRKRSFICQNCSCQFERNEKQAQYCSLSCKTSAINKRRSKIIEVLCEGCGMIREYSVYKEGSLLIDKYCSKKCYANHQHERLTEQCRRIGVENADIISEKAKKRHKEKGHPWIGRNHSEESDWGDKRTKQEERGTVGPYDKYFK